MTFEFAPFFDAGYGWNESRGAFPKGKDETLLSAGIGARAVLVSHLAFEVYWGEAIEDTDPIGENSLQDDGVHLGCGGSGEFRDSIARAGVKHFTGRAVSPRHAASGRASGRASHGPGEARVDRGAVDTAGALVVAAAAQASLVAVGEVGNDRFGSATM